MKRYIFILVLSGILFQFISGGIMIRNASPENSANDIFSSSNAVIMEVIFNRMRELEFKGDRKDLLSKLFDLTLESSKLFREFWVNYLIEVVLNGITVQGAENINLNASLLSEVKLPLIVKMDRPR